MVQISVRTIKLDEKLTFYHFERIFRLPWNIFNRVWNDVVCDAKGPDVKANEGNIIMQHKGPFTLAKLMRIKAL